MADILFTPCVEREIDSMEPIITRFPLDILKSGNFTKVPMMVGNNDKEGIYSVARDFGTSVKEVDTADLTKNDLVFPSEADKNRTAQEIRQFYFSSGEEELVMNMVDLYSDLHFKFPMYVETNLFSQAMEEPIFYYFFKYSGYMNLAKFSSNNAGVVGASHGDEVFYTHRSYILPYPERWLENVMRKRMLTMWTNFAKYSDPTPVTSELLPVKWLSSRDSNPSALVIDNLFSIATLWDESAMRFWNDIYNKYRRRNYGFSNIKDCIHKIADCNDTSNINLLDPE
ncbi:unnamed protein product [Diatraea saccharalis]|uniref:Carboxylesterase type B domain-containing protein n=1 Tax=Diatraea saccharalis TaxID=40085 RepID=A0A9N9WJQ3_9NEOP|nr:unnamed protein product [Diatraea saccharalis]